MSRGYTNRNYPDFALNGITPEKGGRVYEDSILVDIEEKGEEQSNPRLIRAAKID